MSETAQEFFLGVKEKTEPKNWLFTADGQPRGYIDAIGLRELWFHTGTNCNLACPFCLEGSKPGDRRLEFLSLEDVRPYMDAAVHLGVERFAFTGGEPFVNPSMLSILDYALEHKPCLVLTNGTKPLHRRLKQLAAFRNKPHRVMFRVSLDYPDAARHDAGRGQGQFELALDGLVKLQNLGFDVSVARLRSEGEDPAAVDDQFRDLFRRYGLPETVPIVSFPDFLPPYSAGNAPAITEDCMRRYTTPQQRRRFMCAYLRMVLKKNGRVRVYACTLVDDDEAFDLGDNLAEAVRTRVRLKHHRCFACFKYGASCSG